MDSLILAYSFAAAIAIAAGVVLLFSDSIDEALVRVIPAEMSSAWRRYVKFALFTVTFAGGMRLTELAAFIAARTPSGPALTAGQSLLEIFKTVAGSLMAASGALLVIFAAALGVYASMRAYETHRAALRPSRAPERPQAGTERQVGAERHAGAKDRQRTEESGRSL